MAPKALLVLVAAVGQLDPEVVAGPVVGVVVDREEDEQRSLRDLPLLGDGRFHARESSPEKTKPLCVLDHLGLRRRRAHQLLDLRELGHARGPHPLDRGVEVVRRAPELDLRPEQRPVGVPGLGLVRQADAARVEQPCLPDAPVVLHVRVGGDDAGLGHARRELLDPLGRRDHGHALLVAAG